MASRLKAAWPGSRGFVMLPSGVTMTRLQSESSSIFASDLKKHTGGHKEASLEHTINFCLGGPKRSEF
jgi:hypothetical protein